MVTSQGIFAEDTETTLSGVEEEVEGKNDHQSEQAAISDQPMTSAESEQTASQVTAVASVITGSATQSAPASPVHVERSQLVDGSPTKSSDFGQLEWEIPNPKCLRHQPEGRPTQHPGKAAEGKE
jgi:hypothetical protein